MSRLNTLLDMLASNPTDSFLRFALAKEYEKMSDLDAAGAQYQLLLDMDADYVGAYYHYAQVRTRLEKHEEAVQILDAGLQIAQKLGDRHAYSELAELRMNYE